VHPVPILRRRAEARGASLAVCGRCAPRWREAASPMPQMMTNDERGLVIGAAHLVISRLLAPEMTIKDDKRREMTS
jgi:hypothetical protein